MLCMRVESDRACETGGWYHDYNSGAIRPVAPTVKAKIQSIQTLSNASALMELWREKTQWDDYAYLTDELFGPYISEFETEALVSLGAARALPYSQLGRIIHPNAWAFPMSQPTGSIEGIRLRNNEGLKWAVAGSKAGLFMPDETIEKQDIVFLPEGPTDTAAALLMGLYAWGRPNCNSGVVMIREAMKIHQIRKAVIVADNDELKSQKIGRPGIEGARKLQKELGFPSCIFIPPKKDLREYLKAGANHDMIMSAIKQKIWTR